MRAPSQKLAVQIIILVFAIACKNDDPAPAKVAFEFTSNNSSPEVTTAINYALDIWEDHLEIEVPIKINVIFTPINLGSLGRSIPNGRKDFRNAPRPGIWYPSALANNLTGVELNESEFDMDILINGTTNWYYGIDGNPERGQHDFVSVFLHEVCHSLGFGSLSDIENGRGAFSVNPDISLFQPSFPVPDLENRPTVYDVFLETGNRISLTDETVYGNPSSELGNAFTSDDLFWNGNFGQSANSNQGLKIYAPGTFRSGTSIGHLDEESFESGTSNALMSPFISEREVIHIPGPIILGILQDMGWKLQN